VTADPTVCEPLNSDSETPKAGKNNLYLNQLLISENELLAFAGWNEAVGRL
jgi:hypothetical protein